MPAGPSAVVQDVAGVDRPCTVSLDDDVAIQGELVPTVVGSCFALALANAASVSVIGVAVTIEGIGRGRSGEDQLAGHEQRVQVEIVRHVV